MSFNKLKNTFTLLVLTALVLSSVFTVCHLFSMGMDGMAMPKIVSINERALNSTLSCCQNTGVDHALHVSMQDTLTHNLNVEKTIDFSVLFLIIAGYALSGLSIKKTLTIGTYFTNYWEHGQDNYIFRALSQGLLQPKLYNI
jgi:hypothetical protein